MQGTFANTATRFGSSVPFDRFWWHASLLGPTFMPQDAGQRLSLMTFLECVSDTDVEMLY